MRKKLQTKITNFSENFKTFPKNYTVLHPGMFWYCLNGINGKKMHLKTVLTYFHAYFMRACSLVVFLAATYMLR